MSEALDLLRRAAELFGDDGTAYSTSSNAFLGLAEQAWCEVHDGYNQGRAPAATRDPGAYRKVPVPKALRLRVFRRDGWRCQRCGTAANLCVDHIHPERLGGTNDFDNLQTLCRPCNSKKGARVGVCPG